MKHVPIIFLQLALLFCTSCVGLVVKSGERVDYDEKANCDSYHYCQKEPDKIKASFGGEPNRKYVKENKEYWIYEDKTHRGIFLGLILPIPLYFPWTTETTFVFEDGKRIHTSTVKDRTYGFLCGLIMFANSNDPICMSSKKIYGF